MSTWLEPESARGDMDIWALEVTGELAESASNDADLKINKSNVKLSSFNVGREASRSARSLLTPHIYG
jgi:hypothetical protein